MKTTLTALAVIGCLAVPAPSYAWGFKSALNSLGGWLTGTGNNNSNGALWTCSNCLGGYTDFPGSPAPRTGGWYLDRHGNRHYMKPQNLTTDPGKVRQQSGNLNGWQALPQGGYGYTGCTSLCN